MMGDKTAISWTDATWNPLRGCTVVSEGCKNCYAMDVAARFSGPGQPYEGLAEKDSHGHAHWTNKILLVEKHLNDPLHWREPRRIFVNSMSDLFHPDVPIEFIGRVFNVMAQCPQHMFQVLTKRPERMRDVVNVYTQMFLGGVPLPNVWLGTSVELQRWADERIPPLLATLAAVRFLSCEPLLGPLDLSRVELNDGQAICHPLRITEGTYFVGRVGPIKWVIVGGESGRYFRPMEVEWARAIRDQCKLAGAAFFFKQSSGLRPGQGTLLDGVEYHEFPEAA